ncbi:MAG TPA: glycosyltransferase family A protein, partial [Candidatus Sulfotelmatobacter sp.]|nr:glycosyltransferase family A protein [Candidatus Sulfotelmatobacter sp.]
VLPTVSVIIPTYNRARLIGRAVGSVLRQAAAADLEVIVVDDGSTDETEAVLRPYADRIRYIKQPNGGVVAARNRGLAAASGAFVALQDSDDAWEPWKLAAQLRCFELHPALQLVWTNATAVDDANAFLYNDLCHTYYAWQYFRAEDLFEKFLTLDIVHQDKKLIAGATLGIGDLASAMFMGNFIVTPTVLMRREVLAAAGMFDPALGQAMEDYDLFWRICERGPVGFLDVPAVTVRRGARDHLVNADERMAASDLLAVQKYLGRHPAGPKLARRLVAHRLAEAHGRVALIAFEAGDRAGTRNHAFRAILNGTRRKRVFAYALLSLLPAAMTGLSRRLAGRLRPIQRRKGRAGRLLDQ